MASSPVEAKNRKREESPRPDLSMQFAIVRGSSFLCEPNCPEWIWADGEINADTPARLKKFLKTIGDRKLPIVIRSPGGNVRAALAMGRLIRGKGLDVAVGYTNFTSCEPRQENCDAGKTSGYTGVALTSMGYCASACPLVLAGGVRRLVGTWAFLGVHQITTVMVKERILYRTTSRIVEGKRVAVKKIVNRKRVGSYTTTNMNKGLSRDLVAYLKEMGVSPDLLDPIRSTPATGILRLDQADMLSMRLITSMNSVDVLAAPSICRADPAPVNCVMIPIPTARPDPNTTSPVAQPVVTATPDPLEIDRGGSVGEMQFVLVRGSSPLCEPDCPEWISAEGLITARTPKKLSQLLQTVGDRRLPVIISSPGGDLTGALTIGRLIRGRKLNVAVARTRFLGCAPETEGCLTRDGALLGTAIDEGECRSVCPLVLAAGAKRIVGLNVEVTVHRMAFPQEVAIYLDKMNIGPELAGMMDSAKAASPLKLRPLDMWMVDLVNSSGTAKELISPVVCSKVPRPDNCRMLQAVP
jgi:hypothetical protein